MELISRRRQMKEKIVKLWLTINLPCKERINKPTKRLVIICIMVSSNEPIVRILISRPCCEPKYILPPTKAIFPGIYRASQDFEYT